MCLWVVFVVQNTRVFGGCLSGEVVCSVFVRCLSRCICVFAAQARLFLVCGVCVWWVLEQEGCVQCVGGVFVTVYLHAVFL